VTPAERAERFRRSIADQVRRRGLQRDDAALRMLATLAKLQAVLEQLLEGTPSEFDAERIPIVLRQVESHLGQWTKRALGVVDVVLEKAWKIGGAIVDAPLAAVGIHVGGPLIPRSLLEEASRFTAGKIQDIGPRALARIDGEIRDLVLGGKTPHEAMKAVAADLGEQPLPFVGFRSESVIRTEVGRLHSAAADRRLLDVAEEVAGLKKQWLWSGKSRMTHSAVNGQVRDVDGQFDVAGEKLRYPRDPAAGPSNTINCGCESVPYKADW